MNEFTPAYQTIANTCGLCHDQCVSACPVVESSQNLVAYPSRLAAIARELGRGRLGPGVDTWQTLAHCIHCNACTQNCVYIDQPVDVTPLVRWARQSLVENGHASPALRTLLENVANQGSPYGNVDPALKELKGEFPGGSSAGGTLVIADASQLALDLPSAKAALRLLSLLGYRNIQLSDLTYTGWELWQYGCHSAVLEIAHNLARELERAQPDAIVTLAPSSAYLLRQVFPQELGVVVPDPVITMPEAVLARADFIPYPRAAHPLPIFLVPSHTELYQLHSTAAREVLERCGVRMTEQPNRQPFRPAAYSEGLCLDLDPEPGVIIAQRIARMVEAVGPCHVLCTSAFSTQAMQAALPEFAVSDWSGFLIDLFSG